MAKKKVKSGKKTTVGVNVLREDIGALATPKEEKTVRVVIDTMRTSKSFRVAVGKVLLNIASGKVVETSIPLVDYKKIRKNLPPGVTVTVKE